MTSPSDAQKFRHVAKPVFLSIKRREKFCSAKTDGRADVQSYELHDQKKDIKNEVLLVLGLEIPIASYKIDL